MSIPITQDFKPVILKKETTKQEEIRKGILKLNKDIKQVIIRYRYEEN